MHRAKEPVRFIPYIYSPEELKRLLDGVTSYQKKWLKLEPVTLRAMLLLLYGAGLRTSEALHLTCADVDASHRSHQLDSWIAARTRPLGSKTKERSLIQRTKITSPRSPHNIGYGHGISM
ncbi:MAG: tyrosine-type recombinase/integrase [Candidatus Acidiferrales bacterium]